MTPQQVVEGFIDAGTGPRNDWGTARMFLTPDSDWNPNAGVTVYTPGQRSATQTGEATRPRTAARRATWSRVSPR